ncbi:S1 family peptidase [Aliivibrio fischeri]|uniref:S1 family peptidase n=1 Tax=Aliivibrio fischeri TaxID=668 RepID=UPI001F2649EB|nr:serine protease [Aliivibrio fischeri]MCE7556449.1 serine protease [Aliivibrio fischeri]MCE7562986.1 serine protease [Aliivibrio fischeri]MCE7571278.1 serine protease [Aliivibrio fischeri]
MQIVSSDYLKPLVAFKKDKTERFVGSCFFIDNEGTAVTCSHIIEGLAEDEELCTLDEKTNNHIPIDIIWQHDTDDFAIIKLPIRGNKFFNLRYDRPILGLDVMSYGFLNGGVSNQILKIDYRLMKGYVSRLGNEAEHIRSKGVFETSYPSLSGFSGTAVFCQNGNELDLVGMLFQNVESTVEVFAFKEISESGEVEFKESVNRIVEFGLAHTTDTIVRYLNESQVGS